MYVDQKKYLYSLLRLKQTISHSWLGQFLNLSEHLSCSLYTKEE